MTVTIAHRSPPSAAIQSSRSCAVGARILISCRPNMIWNSHSGAVEQYGSSNCG
eukprot:COSAG06_NODE_52866_length_303_cov_0.955882_1_plen_53_part_01